MFLPKVHSRPTECIRRAGYAFILMSALSGTSAVASDVGTLSFDAVSENWQFEEFDDGSVTTQPITVAGCSYSSGTELADVTAPAGAPALNGNKDKLGRADGRQCGEVSDGGKLSIELGTEFGPGIYANGATIETVLKGNAQVSAEVFDGDNNSLGTYMLSSGLSACVGKNKRAAPKDPDDNETLAFACVSDSNPDSDNVFFPWTFPRNPGDQPAGNEPDDAWEWKRVEFTTITGDFAIRSADFNLINRFEGELRCGETVLETGEGTDTFFTTTRLPDTGPGTPTCDLIPYSTIVRNGQAIEVLKDNLGQRVALLIDVDWTVEDVVSNGTRWGGIPLSLQDFQGTTDVDIDLCEGDPEYGSQAGVSVLAGVEFDIGETITATGGKSATLLGYVNNEDETGSILYELDGASPEFAAGDAITGGTSGSTATLSGAPVEAFLRLVFGGSPPADQDPTTPQFDYGCLLQRDTDYLGGDDVKLRELIYLEGDWTARRR